MAGSFIIEHNIDKKEEKFKYKFIDKIKNILRK
jgi:hypothetical protein